MDQTPKLITFEELEDQILKASLGELGYLLGRYCGPHNALLREKVYEARAAKRITRLVMHAIAEREMDIMLTDDLLSDT